MTDPVKIANAALEAQLDYFTWGSVGDRLIESYAAFLSISAESAGRSLGIDPYEAIERLGYTPEALDYYARSELEMFNTGRTVAVSADMLDIAKFNAGIWWEPKDHPEGENDLGIEYEVLSDGRISVGNYDDEKFEALYGARVDEIVAKTGRDRERVVNTALRLATEELVGAPDWSTLGFEADQEGAHLPVLTREMLPFTEPGIMWFEKALPYPDFDMEVIDEYGPAGLPTIPVKAIGWREVPDVTVDLGDDGKPRSGPGIALFMYVDHHKSGRLLRFDFTGWGFNADYEIAHDWIAQFGANTSGSIESNGNHLINPHVAMVRILLTSLFGIMRSSIELTKPARAVRRRAERTEAKFPEYGDVQVITLRTFLGKAAKKSDHTPPTEGVEWRHRWLVRGHWAWRRCNPENADTGEDRRKRVYIESYVKGPEDRPLIIRDKLYAVVR